MSANPNPAELPPQLEAAIGQIRAALQAGADVATKDAAALSCRVLLSVLEARPGQPIQVPTPTAAAAAPAAPASAPVPSPAVPEAPIDRFLTRFVAKFGADVAPDPSVPYVNLGGAASAIFAPFARLAGGR